MSDETRGSHAGHSHSPDWPSAVEGRLTLLETRLAAMEMWRKRVEPVVPQQDVRQPSPAPAQQGPPYPEYGSYKAWSEPRLLDLLGTLPNLTGGMPAEEYVRRNREVLEPYFDAIERAAAERAVREAIASMKGWVSTDTHACITALAERLLADRGGDK